MLTGSPGVFDSYHVKLLKKGVHKALQHKVSRATPLSPGELTKIVRFFSTFGVEVSLFIVGLLLGYLALVRQSNLVSSTITKLGPHILLFRQVRLRQSSLLVTFPSTKTRSSSEPGLLFSLPALPHSLCCPVAAWRTYAHYRSDTCPLVRLSCISLS